jgi:hypothetical protein
MKGFVLILLAVFLCVNAYGATVPVGITTDTVRFSLTHANVVTFDTATSYIELWNESKTADCYVDFFCRDSGGKRGFATSNTVKLLKLTQDGGGMTMNTVALNFSTRNLGFLGDTETGDVTYRITSEQKFE